MNDKLWIALSPELASLIETDLELMAAQIADDEAEGHYEQADVAAAFDRLNQFQQAVEMAKIARALV